MQKSISTSESDLQLEITSQDTFHESAFGTDIAKSLELLSPETDYDRKRIMGYSNQYVALVVATSFCLGYVTCVLNTISNHIALMFEWCGNSTDYNCPRAHHYMALTVTSVFLGGACGSVLSGYVSKLGRWATLLGSCIALGVSSLITCFAVGFWMLLMGRLMTGVAAGALTVISPTYLCEMTPAKVRGARGVWQRLMTTTGILCSIAFGLGVSTISKTGKLAPRDPYLIRGMLGVPAIVMTVCISLMIFKLRDDSPAFLVGVGQRNRAIQVLRRIHAKSDIRVELQALEAANDEAIKRKEEGLSSSFSLVTRKWSYFWVTLVAVVFASGHRICGIIVFISQSNLIFEAVKIPPNLLSWTSSLMALLNLLVTIPATYTIERLGRRTLLLVGLGCQFGFLSLVPITCIFVGWQTNGVVAIVSAISVVGSVVSFALGYGPCLWVYLPEMLTPNIRGFVMGMATCLNWLCAAGATQFGGMLAARHVLALFPIFMGTTFLLLVFFFFVLKETKGTRNSPYIEFGETKENKNQLDVSKAEPTKAEFTKDEFTKAELP